MKRAVTISVLLGLAVTASSLVAAEGAIQWTPFAKKDGRRYLPPLAETARRVWRKLAHPKAAGDILQSVTVDFLYLKPVSGAPPAALAAMERTLRRAFTGAANDSDLGPGELLSECGRSFFKDYEQFLHQFPDTHLPYEAVKQMRVTLESPRLVCVAFQDWSFTGGAHGNGATTYFIFDRQTGGAFDPHKILRPDHHQAVTTLIRRELRKARGLRPSEPLSKADIWEEDVKSAAAELHPGPDGLGFHFNAYSIGPFVIGETDITVPWSDLRAHLTQGFRELASLE